MYYIHDGPGAFGDDLVVAKPFPHRLIGVVGAGDDEAQLPLLGASPPAHGFELPRRVLRILVADLREHSNWKLPRGIEYRVK